MSKRRKIGLGVGGSSLLMIFIIVCLTTFASLSLLSANADYRLSQKTADAASAYYAADALAVERVAAIKALLPQGEAAITAAGLAQADTDGSLFFIEAISDRQQLAVTLNWIDNTLAITSWQVQTSGDWAGDEQYLNIWNGE